MNNATESLKRSIERQLTKLEAEERNLNRVYEGRMRVANDTYYVGGARGKARQEALKAQNRIDEIITRKLELVRQLNSL